jgi:DNA-binding Xre family transcriptional regulator
MAHIKVRVQEVARQKGVRFNELQRKCELSSETINGYWLGKRAGCTFSILTRIAQELGVSPLDLLEFVADD